MREDSRDWISVSFLLSKKVYVQKLCLHWFLWVIIAANMINYECPCLYIILTYANMYTHLTTVIPILIYFGLLGPLLAVPRGPYVVSGRYQTRASHKQGKEVHYPHAALNKRNFKAIQLVNKRHSNIFPYSMFPVTQKAILLFFFFLK